MEGLTMNTNLSPIAETARLETATETLAEYIESVHFGGVAALRSRMVDVGQ